MTQARGKTIQIFLPDGNPRSVKIAEFTSRTIQAVLVPRAQLIFACTREELSNVSLYFLFGEGESGSLSKVYIGEAEECSSRLKQHNAQKDWWTHALVCVSKTREFTKAHVKYLEWFSHQTAVSSGRYKLENGNIPPKPHLSEPVIADLMDHFESIRTLVATLGFPIFEQIVQPTSAELLECKGPDANAKGEYTEDGLVVFKGGLTRKAFNPKSHNYLKGIREALVEDGVLLDEGELSYRFAKDYTFPSPSQAASIVLGRNANGWTEWWYPNLNKTLDDVKRKGI